MRKLLICCILLFSLPTLPWAAGQIRTINELPNLKVNDFFQDSEQYVWISTDYGLCRFNGTDYVHFFHSASDPGSLLSNKVRCARQDEKGQLWVLTEDGLCVMDRSSGSFETILSVSKLNGMLAAPGKMLCYGQAGFVSVDSRKHDATYGLGEKGGVRNAALQKDSLIWAISEDGRSVYCYDMDFFRLDMLTAEEDEHFICASIDGDWLWLGTDSGVKVYDTRAQRFISGDPMLKSLDVLKDENIVVLLPCDDKICICARNKDIHIWSKATGVLNRNMAIRGYFSLSYTSDFSAALFSGDGQIWIGTADRGYAIYNPDEIEFCKGKTLKRITKGKYFNSMSPTEDGILWMASRYKGLLAVEVASSQYLWYKFVDKTDLSKLGDTGLSTVYCDRGGNIWLNMEENKRLASFRDTILPLLMSGDLTC